MDKLKMFAIAIGVLIVFGFIYSRMNPITTTTTTTTTKKAVVVTDPDYVVRYGYRPPPRVYNPYKNQYYN